jgi:cytochrome P450
MAPSPATESVPHAATDGLPPGPGGVLTALVLLRDPLKSLTEAHATFGDATTFRLGHLRFVSVADPAFAQHVLVRNHRNYVKSRSYQGLRLVMGDGLLTSEHDHWRRQRKLAQPAFHRGRLAALADTMAQCVAERLADWDSRSSSAIDVQAEMMQLTLRIVGRTLFGTELGTDLGAFGPAVTIALHKANEFAESIVRLPLWVPTRSNLRFGRAKRLLDGLVHGIIDGRRRSGEQREDLLGALMAATDEDGGGRMDDQQLRDEVMTLFLAGHETIATAMSWTFMLLHQHPEVAARVAAEATAVLGDRRPTFDDLPALPYLGQVIDESMRLYPPAWIVERQALQDDRIGPWRIPRGTIVAVSPWVMHRHPKLWSDPLRFDPERFAPGALDERAKHAYLPFGGGPRVCIGNHFALMEAKIILASVATRYAIAIDDPAAVRLDPKVTLRPAAGMPGRLRRR